MRLRGGICIALLAVCLTLALAGVARAGKPVLVLSGDLAPLVAVDMPGFGAASQIVEEAFRVVGYEPTFEFYPWKRCELLLAQWPNTVAMPYFWTEGRSPKYLFSKAILLMGQVFFYRRDRVAFEYEGIESLRPYRIGGVLGYNYRESFDAAGLDVHYSQSLKQAMTLLELGRVDVVPENSRVGWEMLSRLFPERLSEFGATKGKYTYAGANIIAWKGHPESQQTVDDFNRGLAMIRESGMYDIILRVNGIKP